MKNPRLVIALSFVGFMTVATVPLLLLRALPEQPVRPVPVQVDAMYGEWGHCRQSTAIVFHTADGRRGQDWMPTAAVACHPGDWIAGEAVGASLRLASAACRRPEPIVGSRAC